MFIDPMLASSISDKKMQSISPDEYSLEVKHDGMRAIVSRTSDGVHIYSRTGKEVTDRIPKLSMEFLSLDPGTILDGELMVTSKWLNSDEFEFGIPVPDFNKTMRIMGSNADKAVREQNISTIDFHIFDVIMLGGDDLTNMSYNKRSSYLSDILNSFGDESNIYPTESLRNWSESTFKWLIDNGVEGAILKNNHSLYIPGKRRANTWYKLKIEQTADVVVMGFTEANEGKTGRWLGKIGAIVFGAYNADGELVEVGQCSGMSDAERDRWTAIRDSGTWHGKVIEIKYNDLVGAGTPRHPQYRTERLDKNPEDCLLDQFTKG